MEILKFLRDLKGLSQRDLSKATGLSQAAIVHWENNDRVPSATAVVKLAKFFGVSTDYLLGMTAILKFHGEDS